MSAVQVAEEDTGCTWALLSENGEVRCVPEPGSAWDLLSYLAHVIDIYTDKYSCTLPFPYVSFNTVCSSPVPACYTVREALDHQLVQSEGLQHRLDLHSQQVQMVVVAWLRVLAGHLAVGSLIPMP
jgi:hypothetical protein